MNQQEINRVIIYDNNESGGDATVANTAPKRLLARARYRKIILSQADI